MDHSKDDMVAKYLGGFHCKRCPNQNLIHKLWQRQLPMCSSSEIYHHNRSIYHCVVPNHTEQGVQPPAGFLRKFSPDGHFLLAFSNDQRNVLVYDYRGASAGQVLYSQNRSGEEIRYSLFDQFFKQRYSIPVAQNGEHLNRECSVFTEDCQYMLVVSSAAGPDDPPMLEILDRKSVV